MAGPVVLRPLATRFLPPGSPKKKQSTRRTIASIYPLAGGNHHPDPLLHAALRSASLRFRESHLPDPLFIDPYAGCLIESDADRRWSLTQESTGYRLAIKYVDEKLIETMKSEDELRQVVLLTDGMDTRPFRLNWPRSSAIFDVSPGSVFQFASQKLEGVGAKISRNCILDHVPLESSNILEILCEKGFDGNRPSIWALQGLPLMTSIGLDDVLSLVSSLAMKGCIFLGELPWELTGAKYCNMLAAQKCIESLFMSHGFRVSMVDYAEVAGNLQLDLATEISPNAIFIAKQLRLSDAQMERWRSEYERLEEEADEEGFEEL